MVIGAITDGTAAAAAKDSTVLHASATTARLGAAGETLAHSLHTELALAPAALFETSREI